MLLQFAFALLAFTWQDADGRLTLRDGDQPVIAYNYAPRLENGAPAVKRRSGYVHPVWAPDGIVVTDDFPRDHWHHRGLFWAWPVIRYGGKSYDMWTLTGGIESRFVKWLDRKEGKQAVLSSENGWYVGDTQIATERVRIEAFPLNGMERRVDFEITLTPVVAFAMAGMQDGKGYGGFNARFAPREATVVRSDSGTEAKDTDLVPHGWAELEATYNGKRERLRITSDSRNPGHPQGWCLRHYGFIGANYPGLQVLDMQPGKSVTLRYSVTIASVK